MSVTIATMELQTGVYLGRMLSLLRHLETSISRHIFDGYIYDVIGIKMACSAKLSMTLESETNYARPAQHGPIR